MAIPADLERRRRLLARRRLAELIALRAAVRLQRPEGTRPDRRAEEGSARHPGRT